MYRMKLVSYNFCQAPHYPGLADFWLTKAVILSGSLCILVDSFLTVPVIPAGYYYTVNQYCGSIFIES
jgi:hypothetical protein